MASGIDWTEETIARLRVFWRDGITTAEIGRRMGTSKNAVIGKAHRLGLPPRPSPIRAKNTGSTPHLPAPACPAAGDLPPERPARPPAALQTPPTRADPVPPPILTRPDGPAPACPAARHPCCWPIGHPGTPGFRFCGAEAMPRKPYCAEHAGTAYVEPEAARDRPVGRGLNRFLRRGLIRTP